MVWWNLSPLPVHGVESRCWRQLRDALYVARHVSQGPFHSYGVRRHLVNRARNDVLHKSKRKEKLFSICLATHQRKSGTWPLQTTPHPRARRAGIVPVVARGVVSSLIGLCTMHDILEIRSLFSLVSSNCVVPFSCCFRFLLKFSALKKFTTTGAGYGPLLRAIGTQYNVCVIIENCWRK